MKPLNFTEKKILKGLLDKTKTQTIRPAWIIEQAHKGGLIRQYNRKAKYKVGDIVPVVWDRDSKDEWFCRICGRGDSIEHHDMNDETCSPIGHLCNPFNKNLGKVKITEVFEIGIEYMSIYKRIFPYHISKNENWSLNFEEDLAKRDG